MIGYVVRRLLVAVVLVWLVTVVTFVFYAKVPEDTASFLVDMQKATPADIAKAHHILGTDQPFTTQYAKFLWRALHGDFGVSWQTATSTPAPRMRFPLGRRCGTRSR